MQNVKTKGVNMYKNKTKRVKRVNKCKKQNYRCVVRIVLGRTDPYSKLTAGGVHPKTTAAVFPRGSKKRKSNNDDKRGHGQEKRRPTTLSWGKR